MPIPTTVKLDFLKEWSKKWSMDEAVLKTEFEQEWDAMKAKYPNDAEKDTMSRTCIMVSGKHRRDSSGTAISGLIVYAGDAHDSWQKKKTAIWVEVANLEVAGKLEEAVKQQMIRIDENGNKKLLHPKYTKAGELSKNAGKEIQKNEHMVRDVFMLEWVNDHFEGVRIERRGDAALKPVPVGKFATFSGKLAKADHYRGAKYESSKGDFVLANSPVPLDFDMAAAVEKAFPKNIVALRDVINFAASGVPQEYKNFVIIKDVLVSDMDLSPKAKKEGKKATISFRYADGSDNMDIMLDLWSYAYADNFKEGIKWGKNTKGNVIGRAFIGKPKEGYETKTAFETIKIFPYKGFETPVQEINDVTEDDINPTIPKQEIATAEPGKLKIIDNDF